MADNGTLGRILTMTVNGPSDRMKGLSAEVAALLNKPKGQITQQEVDDLLGKIDEMRHANPPLNHTEALNRLSFSKSVADRAVNEGLMTPGQYMNRPDALQIGVAGMYGGGSARMPRSGGATGPVLPRTGAATGQRPLPAGSGVAITKWQVPSNARAKVPKSWGNSKPNKKAGKSGRADKPGERWEDPENPKGNRIRIDKGDPNSPFPSQRVDHVIIQSDGRVIGLDGAPIKGSIQQNAVKAHIPLSIWEKWGFWNKP